MTASFLHLKHLAGNRILPSREEIVLRATKTDLDSGIHWKDSQDSAYNFTHGQDLR